MSGTKNADYSNSAVNLCNPPELHSLLCALSILEAEEFNLTVELERTDTFQILKTKREEIASLLDTIRETIEAKGSYQDPDAGEYALKQRKLSVTYIAGRVREFLRDFADAVIEEVVNKKKIEGLRKGGLISPDDLARCSETTESFAFIIHVGKGR